MAAAQGKGGGRSFSALAVPLFDFVVRRASRNAQHLVKILCLEYFFNEVTFFRRAVCWEPPAICELMKSVLSKLLLLCRKQQRVRMKRGRVARSPLAPDVLPLAARALAVRALSAVLAVEELGPDAGRWDAARHRTKLCECTENRWFLQVTQPQAR